ncbi:hypothetical protein D3C86_2017920 [compost metagenome]
MVPQNGIEATLFGDTEQRAGIGIKDSNLQPEAILVELIANLTLHEDFVMVIEQGKGAVSFRA